MSESLRVTILEVPARRAALPQQIEWIDNVLRQSPASDVVVLPEACLTGYVSPALEFDLSGDAEPLQGQQLELLRTLAAAHQTTIVGPIIERDGTACFNSMVVVTHDGTMVAHYRKRHPWMPERWATSGTAPYPQFELGGRRCTLAICFDIHFLEHEAPALLAANEILFFCSAWVDDEGDTRGPMLDDLARRFDLTIVNANWGPGVPRLMGQGGSLVVSPQGSTRVRSGDVSLSCVV